MFFICYLIASGNFIIFHLSCYSLGGLKAISCHIELGSLLEALYWKHCNVKCGAINNINK